jgi:5-methylcytosine-specific restriction endonuclease McrA
MNDNNDNLPLGLIESQGNDSGSRTYKAAKAATRKATQHHRRVIAKGDERGSFTGEEWLKLCELYGNRCALCGFERPLTPDHVVPVYLGGPNTIDNIQPLCRPCNMAKYRTVADYRGTGTPVSAASQQHSALLEAFQLVHSASGDAAPAPRPIWRDELVTIGERLLNATVAESAGPSHSAACPSAPLGREQREQDLTTWRGEVRLALVAEIRRLRALVLENEGLASVESVAWWSRGSLPAALEAYLSLQRRGGENS